MLDRLHQLGDDERCRVKNLDQSGTVRALDLLSGLVDPLRHLPILRIQLRLTIPEHKQLIRHIQEDKAAVDDVPINTGLGALSISPSRGRRIEIEPATHSIGHSKKWSAKTTFGPTPGDESGMVDQLYRGFEPCSTNRSPSFLGFRPDIWHARSSSIFDFYFLFIFLFFVSLHSLDTSILFLFRFSLYLSSLEIYALFMIIFF
jgi:hypothetical protein